MSRASSCVIFATRSSSARLFSSMSLAVFSASSAAVFWRTLYSCASAVRRSSSFCLRSRAGLARVEVIRFFVEGFLALGHAALAALHLGAAVANLAIQLVLQADDLFLRLEDAFLLLLLRTALRVVQQITGIFLGAPDILFLHVLAIHVACRNARGQRG